MIAVKNKVSELNLSSSKIQVLTLVPDEWPIRSIWGYSKVEKTC